VPNGGQPDFVCITLSGPARLRVTTVGSPRRVSVTRQLTGSFRERFFMRCKLSMRLKLGVNADEPLASPSREVRPVATIRVPVSRAGYRELRRFRRRRRSNHPCDATGIEALPTRMPCRPKAAGDLPVVFLAIRRTFSSFLINHVCFDYTALVVEESPVGRP